MKTSALAKAYPWDEFERVVVLSPHLDDAALSCGGLLQFLRGCHPSCLVITVYCGNPPALKGKDGTYRIPQRKGYVNPRLRRREDIEAMRMADADYVHLGFSDGIYRRSPLTHQFIYRHAHERWVAPRVDDMAHIEELFLVLQRLCLNLGRILLVAPMGIGHHVDHTIVAQVAIRLAERGPYLLFYEDFPYVVDREVGSGLEDDPGKALARLRQEPSRRLFLPVDPAVKGPMIARYSSQIPALFDDVRGIEEALMARIYQGRSCEFYWKTRDLRTARQEGE